MKIDLHCHTKSTKTGDSPNRNISCSEFIKNMVNKQVSIVAITNHNYFDEEQYLEFYNEAKKNNIDVWTGIELDVIGKNSRGHIIVISNPKELEDCDN